MKFYIIGKKELDDEYEKISDVALSRRDAIEARAAVTGYAKVVLLPDSVDFKSIRAETTGTTIAEIEDKIRELIFPLAARGTKKIEIFVGHEDYEVELTVCDKNES